MTLLFRRALLLACACLVGTSALAAFPDKPVRLIVPWAPGGSTDAIARAIAQRMGESLGQVPQRRARQRRARSAGP